MNKWNKSNIFVWNEERDESEEFPAAFLYLNKNIIKGGDMNFILARLNKGIPRGPQRLTKVDRKELLAEFLRYRKLREEEAAAWKAEREREAAEERLAEMFGQLHSAADRDHRLVKRGLPPLTTKKSLEQLLVEIPADAASLLRSAWGVEPVVRHTREEGKTFFWSNAKHWVRFTKWIDTWDNWRVYDTKVETNLPSLQGHKKAQEVFTSALLCSQPLQG